MFEDYENQDSKMHQADPISEMEPIELEGKGITKLHILKWLFFLFFIIYILLSYYHAPILTRIGRYLIVEHPPEKSDLIVCLAGGNIERGLATADAYKEGLAPRIYISREEVPDGYDLLEETGLKYPKQVDLLTMLLKESGVPESAILTGESTVKSTMEEAQAVRKEVGKRELQSIIIITSPTHTRRTWLTYRHVFEDSNVRILVMSSKYSKFRPEDWWEKRRYIREVIIEYEKLIYYTLKYFL